MRWTLIRSRNPLLRILPLPRRPGTKLAKQFIPFLYAICPVLTSGLRQQMLSGLRQNQLRVGRTGSAVFAGCRILPMLLTSARSAKILDDFPLHDLLRFYYFDYVYHSSVVVTLSSPHFCFLLLLLLSFASFRSSFPSLGPSLTSHIPIPSPTYIAPHRLHFCRDHHHHQSQSTSSYHTYICTHSSSCSCAYIFAHQNTSAQRIRIPDCSLGSVAVLACLVLLALRAKLRIERESRLI